MTLKQVQALQLAQVGVHESPNGSNRVLYSLWYGLVGAWCMMYQVWVFTKAGIPIFRTASTQAFVAHYRKIKGFHEGSGGVQPGDLMFYHWPGSSRAGNQPDHVEFVFSTAGAGVNDIGGNVGNKVSRIRRTGNFLGYVRPTYAPEPKPAARKYPGHILKKGAHGSDVVWIQKRLTHHGIKTASDGIFGPATAANVHTFRRKCGWAWGYTVGPKTWARLAK